MLLVASCGIEALRFHSIQASLPLAPGGLFGAVIGQVFHGTFGFTGATLLLLAMGAIGLSLFTGISWVELMEAIGRAFEGAWFKTIELWQRREDRKAGEIAAVKREVVVEAEKKRVEDHEPIRIEAPVREIQKSERVIKEKQVPLFQDLPDTPLPPLALLDEAPPDPEQMSAETLEFTSRLIEKKLNDFGVEVKVLAAYPGPVITRYEIEPAVGVKGSQIINLVKDLARALSVVSHPRGRDHSRQVVHGARDPEPAAPDRAAVRDPRARRRITTCTRRSRSRSARTSPATRWWPTSRACRTCSSPARPAPASRSRSTP